MIQKNSKKKDSLSNALPTELLSSDPLRLLSFSLMLTLARTEKVLHRELQSFPLVFVLSTNELPKD
jgi:hypothetical protein